MELQDFVDLWCHPEYPPAPVSLSELTETEKELNSALPADHRTQLLAVGAPAPTLALLGAIVDADIDLPDLQELHAPAQIVGATRDWVKAGMPPELVAIGTDALGASFCLDRLTLTRTPVASSRILRWDP